MVDNCQYLPNTYQTIRFNHVFSEYSLSKLILVGFMTCMDAEITLTFILDLDKSQKSLFIVYINNKNKLPLELLHIHGLINFQFSLGERLHLPQPGMLIITSTTGLLGSDLIKHFALIQLEYCRQWHKTKFIHFIVVFESRLLNHSLQYYHFYLCISIVFCR